MLMNFNFIENLPIYFNKFFSKTNVEGSCVI